MPKRRAAAAPAGDPVRRGLLAALLVAVPLAVDPGATDPFSTVKVGVLVAGVAALGVATAWRWSGWAGWPRIDLLSGLVLALAAWAAVGTVAGVNPRYSVLGAYGSYDGLAAAVVFAVLFLLVASTVDAGSLRATATVLHLGAGGPVVLYALVQVHDRATSWGGTWDPFDWPSVLNTGWVWSTMGNPNHLAAVCAVLVPLGLALVVAHRERWRQAPVAAVTAGAIVVLVYTGTRGAWLGALAGLATLAVLLARDLAAHRRVAVWVGAGVLAAGLVASLVAGRDYDVARQFASAFDLDDPSAVERTELWRAALDMAADHPLAGVGPDAYRLLFNRYESSTYARRFGADLVANGPHDVFLAHLAAGGVPALLLFLALLAAAGARARKGLAALADARPPPDGARLVLAGVAAALVAFVVQAAFNTQEVDLNFWFWALLGMLAGATAAPREPAPRRGRPSPGRRVRTAVVALVVVVALTATWLATRPYRADRQAVAASRQAGVAVAYARQGLFRDGRAEADAAARLFGRARELNPWQPDYPAAEATFLLELARFEQRAADARVRAGVAGRLAEGRRAYRRAVALEPQNALLLAGYTQYLLDATGLAAPGADFTAEALAVARRARRANPHDRHVAALLATLEGQAEPVSGRRRGRRPLRARPPAAGRRWPPRGCAPRGRSAWPGWSGPATAPP